MPLYGTLKAMPLPDLIQWLGTARRSGTLRVERDKVSKSIDFDEGLIVGCSSDEPAQKLGQFLLARGRITEQQLCDALELQSVSGAHLGATLVQMGAIEPADITTHLEAQTEEIIYSIFEWEDAVFRFQEGPISTANGFTVNMRVDDVLLRGLKRWDEVQEIRQVFSDPGIVLVHTDKPAPSRVMDNPTGRGLYELINGERTVAEILLQVHSSEYAVTKFLHDLHQTGLVEIVGVKSLDPAAAAPDQTEPEVPVEDLLSDWDPDEPVIDRPAPSESPAPLSTEPVVATAVSEPEESQEVSLEPVEQSDAQLLARKFQIVRQRMSKAEFEQALDILDDLYKRFPGDESLRRLTAEAEAAFTEKAYRHYLPPSKIPVLAQTLDVLETESLSPTEFFLLSRMDGSWDVKSIVQLAPIREADVLRTLKRLREQGVFRLDDPE